MERIKGSGLAGTDTPRRTAGDAECNDLRIATTADTDDFTCRPLVPTEHATLVLPTDPTQYEDGPYRSRRSRQGRREYGPVP